MIVMTALSSAGWNGMAFIDDIDSGVMDRFLVSPVWRGALNLGSMVYSALTIAMQSVIICGLAYAVGAHFRNGILGVVSLVVIACTLGASFAALSNALALVARQRETLIGAVTFVLLPLDLPVRRVHAAQPRAGLDRATWRASTPSTGRSPPARAAGARDADWTVVLTRLGLLAALLLLATILATRAFRAYQHSI